MPSDASISAMVSALCSLLGLVFQLGPTLAIDHPGMNFNKWTGLDPDYLKEQWKWRRDSASLMTTGAVFEALSWATLIPPIFSYCVFVSRGGTRSIGTIGLVVAFILMGALMATIELLMRAGESQTADWVSTWDGVDNFSGEGDGWRYVPSLGGNFSGDGTFSVEMATVAAVASPSPAPPRSLELAWVTVQGARVWVDAFDRLGLAVAVGGMLSALKHSDQHILNHFPRTWRWLAVAVVSVSMGTVVCDVGRFANWKVFGAAAAAFNILARGVVIPVWLVITARILERAGADKHQPLPSEVLGAVIGGGRL